jgi:hypothetical protein
MMKMRNTFVLFVLGLISTGSVIANIQTAQVLASANPPQSERFFIDKEFWAFAGTYVIGSFNATSGDYLALNISSVNIDPDRPNDHWVVELGINTTKQGTSYVSGTQFSQTIMLNYTDCYTITAAKHQFWSSIRVSGEVTVCHNPVPLVTNSSSPASAISSTPNPSRSLIPTGSPTPEVPELPPLLILPILILAVFTVIILKTQVKTKRREDLQLATL